ncbi:SpaA isopeptide-forming pilin-related protein [Microbacteriaceae bacterium 4G12]
MRKALNICLIILVTFSQFFTFSHSKVKAEESIGNTLFDSVEMKDENSHIINEALNPNNKIKLGSTIQLEYAWSMKANQVVHANDTVVLAVPSELKVKTDTQGNVMVDQTNIGQFFVTASDNKMKLVFNDQAEKVKDGKGKLKFETVFSPSVKPDTKSVQIVFPLGETSQSISVPIATANSQNTTSNMAWLQSVTATTSNGVTDTTPKQITENILTNVTMTDQNDKPFNDPNNRPNTDSPANIYFDWSLPESLHAKKGDYYTFNLPTQFIIYNTVTGDLIDGNGDIIGTFVVTKDGQVTMTFNEKVENDPNISGKLELHTQFNKEKIKGSTKQEIVFPIKDKDVSITIDFKPNINQSTDKSGSPNKQWNADQIAWTVNVNKTKDTLTNVIVKDPMPAGLSLNTNSIKVYHLDVDIDGNTTLGAEADPNEYTIISSNGSNLEIAFKDKINQAYQIQYTTKITDDTVTTFDNTVTVSSDNIKDQTATATVTVPHGKHLDKTSAYDPKIQTVNWTITYNGDEKTIKHNDAILKDLFDNTHQLVAGSIEVKKATYDAQGNLTAGDLITDYTVTPTTADKKNGFDLQFTNDITNAYIITYKTKSVSNVINDGQVTNTVTADSNSNSSNTADFAQQNIIKSHGSPNYKDKTTTWSIVVNNNNYEMNNAVITDTFASGGLTLQDGTFKIHDNESNRDLQKDTDYTLNVTGSGFTVNLIGSSYSKTTSTLVITYTTKFDYSKISADHSIFKNTADVTWKDASNNEQKSSSTATFDPDWFTKFNGFKTGSYNAQTKEITWQIGVNYNNLAIQDPSVSDVLHDGQKLVPGSVEVRYLTLTGAEYGYQIGDKIPVNQYSIDDPTDKNGNTLTVHFNQSINSAYYITFKTTIDGELIKDRYDNTVILKDGSTNVSQIGGAVGINNGGKFVTKTAQQDDKYINWSVSINESQSTLAHAKITDNPTDNQIIVADSFHLYPTTVDVNGNLTKDTTNELKQDIDYTLKITTDNDTGKQQFEVAFLKPIDRAYILDYKTFINAGNNEKVSNAVKLSADRITTENVETVEEIIVKVSSGSGTGSNSKGALGIKKVDAADKNKTLAGAEFTLYDSTGKTVIRTLTTDNTGIVTFNNLRYGDYLLKETKAPKGYLISEELKTGKLVTVNSKNNNNYTLENTKYVGKVVLTKTDNESGEKLKDAIFTLQDQNGNTVSGYEKLTTDDQGQLTADDLQPGSYQLKETKAPANYDLDGKPIPFTIAENQTTVIKVSATNSLTKGGVELTKIDADDKHALEGAVFSLQDKDGKDIQIDLKTNQNGKIVVHDLKPGDYQFVETKAPIHYDLSVKPIKFTIEKGQTKIAEVTATNSLTTGSVELTKVDADDKHALEGAIFSLQDKDGKDLQKDLKSDKDGKIVVHDLKPGDYQFVETKAPTDYDLNATPIKFTIEKSQVKVVQVTATNSLTKGGVELTKLDEDGKTVLQGAVFSLQDKDGNELQKALTTDKDGKIVVRDLKQGDYQFVETKAPTGYDLNATPIKFTIERGQTKLAEVTAINSLTTGGVELTKVDADDKQALEGAVFSLQDKDGKELQKDLTTDKDGKIVVKDLKPGDYQFVETKAPKGYQLNNSPVKFTVEKGQQNVVKVTVSNKKIIEPSTSGDRDPSRNKEDALPETGHNHIKAVIGLILLLAGVLTLVSKRRKKDYR